MPTVEKFLFDREFGIVKTSNSIYSDDSDTLQGYLFDSRNYLNSKYEYLQAHQYYFWIIYSVFH